MHKTLATLYKLKLMCVREEKAVGASWEYKSSEKEWVGAEADKKTGRENKMSEIQEKMGRKDWGSKVRYCSFCT